MDNTRKENTKGILTTFHREDCKPSSQERFETWLGENRKLYKLFWKYALRARYEKNFEQYGIKALAEVLRWEVPFEKRDEYKVNNNYLSLIARKLMAEDPMLAGFFETRLLAEERM